MIVLAALFVADRVVGLVMEHWLCRITTGVLGKDNYICDHCDEEVLVFGSSRTMMHYNAKMMEEELGHTVYNCGGNGYGIILSYGRLLMISERYHPQLIVMEVTPEFDLVEYNDNLRDLGELKRHYDRKGVSGIFSDIEHTEKYKMMSYLYRYNSDFLHNPLRMISKKPFDRNNVGVQGFIPSDIDFDEMRVKEFQDDEKKPDPIKLSYLKRFVDLALKHSRLVFVVSPYWDGRDSGIFKPARQLADSLGIPFLDFSNDPKYIHNDKYFRDGIHLNARGADVFTADLVRRLKDVMREDTRAKIVISSIRK